MKVSLEWIKEYTPIKLPVEELVEKIGSQLGAVESVTNYGDKYKGATIVKVVACQDHPNAERLHICKIDDNQAIKDVPREEDGLIQVICGAPNIAEGQMVAWLPPGATVPESYSFNKPTILESRLVREVLSHGMIASERELALGNDQTGILVIDQSAKAGTPLAEFYDLNDTIVEIENKMFTHRPDCFGILGVAREIAGIQRIEFNSPDWYLKSYLQMADGGTGTLPLTIRNELPELVPRLMAVAMSNVKIKPSPVKMQSYLNRLGVRPINNIVDISNYIMLLTGQPLHIYDYDKVKALDPNTQHATLVARYPKKGEKLKLINGKEVEPVDGTVLISTDTQAIGLAGVMGGGDTEVDDNTKNIIIECASFDMYAIRRSSMAHGVFSDASTRYSKGQSPLQDDSIVSKTISLVTELAGGVVSSPVLDDHHMVPINPVKITAEFINDRLGSNIDIGQIVQLLKNVEFNVSLEGQDIIVKAPFWRTDIAIPEDVVEEVGRLYGYENIKMSLPQKQIKPAGKNELFELKSSIRNILSAAGANELLTYNFVHGNLLTKTDQNPDVAFQLNNALSPDLQFYRLSLSPSLLDKIRVNIKSGYKTLALFELNKCHIRDWLDEERLPKEEDRLGLVFASEELNESGPAYFQAMKYLLNLLEKLGIKANFGEIPQQAQQEPNKQMAAPFAPERSAIVTDAITGGLLGIIGEIKPSVKEALKLPKTCAGFELDTARLLKHVGSSFKYEPLPKFPKVEQDITIQVESGLHYTALEQAMLEVLSKVLVGKVYKKVHLIDIYQSKDDKLHKNITLHVELASYDSTLKAAEVNALLDSTADALKQHFFCQRI
jgi:phenylalanyl-tRNA synthetase beta chain